MDRLNITGRVARLAPEPGLQAVEIKVDHGRRVKGQELAQREAAVPEEDVARVLDRVRRFDEWTTDNDPHGEHDFGSFECAGVTYFFKFDYYSPDLQGGSEDPADPEKTTRVLTIMRADEY
jgi:hypothetical protein